MFRLSAVVREIERRARRLNGRYLAGYGFGLGSLLSLVSAGLCRLELFCLNWPLVLCLLGFLPVVSGFLFYLFGFSRAIHLPRLLLKVDHALQTEERLSSLYELRQRSSGKVFRDRIEAYLEERSFRWQKGLAFRWRRFGSLALGGTLLLGLAILIVFPSTPSPSLAATSPTSPSSTENLYSHGASPSPSKSELAETTSAPTSSVPGRELPVQKFEDPLSEIWNQPSSEGALVEESADLSELLEEQRRLSEQLSELLSRIKERLEQQKEEGTEGLTEAERQAVMALLPQIAQPEIEDALESLLTETDPEALEDYIEQAEDLTQGLSRSPEAPTDTDDFGEEAPREEDLQQEQTQPFSWEMTDQPQEEGGSERQDTAPVDREQSSPDTEEDWRLEGEDDRTGGKEASETEGEETIREELPGFVQEELAGTLGPRGDFQDFITKGVPLEPGSDEEGKGIGVPFFIDYETMRAILEGRAIPTDSRETVKKYFQFITQGET